MTPVASSLSANRFTAEGCRLDDFRAVVETATDPARYPRAVEVVDRVPVYDGIGLGSDPAGAAGRVALLDELADAMLHGPGIVMIRAAVDGDAVDRTSAVFEAIIAQQQEMAGSGGDHFAPPGTNDRIWNALEKLAIADPEAFADYYRSETIAIAAEAWLGPGYQLTSQINVVNPGGGAQRPHRDYHLGFMTDEAAERYPSHIHLLSPLLTLQGAVAHCDMPVATGPTMYLPHSQKYGPGYLAWRREDFIAYFEQHHVQLPLRRGDAVFFNPALFHAAGTNSTATVERMANLLQISSPMGRAMEQVDRRRMCLALYPTLSAWRAAGRPAAAVDRVVAASAEGYPFPTDLDRDQPIDGLAPASQADLVRQALSEGWTPQRLDDALAAHAAVRTP